MRNKFISAIMAGAVALFILGHGAGAQTPNCGERQAIVDQLYLVYGETRRSIGLGESNVIVETFASEETGSWTITVMQPTGLMCLVASGQHYEELQEVLPPKGDPT